VLLAILRVSGRAGDQLEPPLQRQHHVGFPPVADLRRHVAEARARERPGHRRVGVDFAVARRVPVPTADQQADEHLAGVVVFFLFVALARLGLALDRRVSVSR